MKIRSFLLAMMLCALCCVPAHALEYDFDAPEDYLELARVFWTIFFGKSKMPSPISCLEIIAFYLAWSPITKFLMRSAVIEKARRNREDRSNTKLKGKSIRSKAGDCESQSPCILYS